MPAVPVFQGKSLNTAAAPIQLLHKRWKPNALESKKEHAGEAAAAKVSAAVDTAHAELNVNNLADASPAFQALYLLRLNEHGRGVGSMHPSTAAGYIIESKVNNRLSGEADFNFQNSTLLPGTRPDITVDLGDEHTALIDITAGNSLGHIFNKKGNWANHGKIPYVSEAWYPSIDFTGKAENLTPDQIRAAEAMAENRKALADLMRAEKIRQKTETFNEWQRVILKKFERQPSGIFTLLRRNKRMLSVLINVGIDIDANTDKPLLLSVSERNLRCGLTPTAANPVPKYLQAGIVAAQDAIDNAGLVAAASIRTPPIKRPKKTLLRDFKKGKVKRIGKPAKTRKE